MSLLFIIVHGIPRVLISSHRLPRVPIASHGLSWVDLAEVPCVRNHSQLMCERTIIRVWRKVLIFSKNDRTFPLRGGNLENRNVRRTLIVNNLYAKWMCSVFLFSIADHPMLPSSPLRARFCITSRVTRHFLECNGLLLRESSMRLIVRAGRQASFSNVQQRAILYFYTCRPRRPRAGQRVSHLVGP